MENLSFIRGNRTPSQAKPTSKKSGSGSGRKYTLVQACNEGRTDVVASLIKRGAKVNQCDRRGLRPMHFAAQSGHLAVVELLRANGAGIDPVSTAGWTPLHLAASNGHLQLANYLVIWDADPEAKTDDSETPYSLAKESEHKAFIKAWYPKN